MTQSPSSRTLAADPPPCDSRRPRRRAVSLVEAMMAMSILAIGVVAVTAALTAGAQQTAAVAEVRLATELAEALMEEILALPFADPDGASALGPEAGESRLTFDNTDDFHGHSEAAGTVAMADGSAYPAAYARFAREATMSTTTMQPAGFPSGVDGLQVTVTVTLEGRTLAVLTRFVAHP